MRTGLPRLILLPVAVFAITAVTMQIVIPRLYEQRLIEALSRTLEGAHDAITSELVQIQQTTEFVSQSREFSLLRSQRLREILPVLTVEVNALVDDLRFLRGSRPLIAEVAVFHARSRTVIVPRGSTTDESMIARLMALEDPSSVTIPWGFGSARWVGVDADPHELWISFSESRIPGSSDLAVRIDRDAVAASLAPYLPTENTTLRVSAYDPFDEESRVLLAEIGTAGEHSGVDILYAPETTLLGLEYAAQLSRADILQLTAPLRRTSMITLLLGVFFAVAASRYAFIAGYARPIDHLLRLLEPDRRAPNQSARRFHDLAELEESIVAVHEASVRLGRDLEQAGADLGPRQRDETVVVPVTPARLDEAQFEQIVRSGDADGAASFVESQVLASGPDAFSRSVAMRLLAAAIRALPRDAEALQRLPEDIRVKLTSDAIQTLNTDEIVDLVLEIVQLVADRSSRSTHRLDIQSVVEYVDSHFQDDIYLVGVAERFGVNDRYLSHRFSEHVGTPFSDYLTRSRCEAAARLLAADDRPVREIGAAVGFRNPTSFFRSFKAVMGSTPTEYRRSNS